MPLIVVNHDTIPDAKIRVHAGIVVRSELTGIVPVGLVAEAVDSSRFDQIDKSLSETVVEWRSKRVGSKGPVIDGEVKSLEAK